MSGPALEIQNLAKHCHEALILAVLRDGPKHGYQMALDIEERGGGFFRFNHGTLYPILHKLEQDGLIKGTWSREESERRKKSYALTGKGRRYAAQQAEGWREFIRHLLEVIGENS